MTKDSSLSSMHLMSLLLAVVITGIGTHVFDVFQVKGAVDSIQTNQKGVSDYIVQDKIRWEKFDKEDLPTILNGQRVIVKCMYAIKHGELDKECDWELWRENSKRNQYMAPEPMNLNKNNDVPVVIDKVMASH